MDLDEEIHDRIFNQINGSGNKISDENPEN